MKKEKSVLLEIGTEELPPFELSDLSSQFKSKAERLLKDNRINYQGMKTFASSRRLVLFIDSISDKQDTLEKEITGPSAKAAFDNNGKPTQAALGFAKSHGINVSSLVIKKTEKGEYVCAKTIDKGRETGIVLKEIFPVLMSSFEFKKSMRWEDSGVRFARPVRWILSLYGNKIIKFKFADIESSNKTYGHRFISKGAKIVRNSEEYTSVMKKNKVIIDNKVRIDEIKKLRDNAAKKANGIISADIGELTEEIAGMIEYPAVVLGEFPKEFLNLPKEVLITAMKHHQRYIPIEEPDGKLKRSFIIITNGITGNEVKIGHEHVLNSRLKDAEFFYKEDIKIRLEDRVEGLKNVLWQKELGTLYDKTKRLESLCEFMIKEIGLNLAGEDTPGKIKRAAFLSKADLLTEMVREFPELQGVMGSEYARISGEPKEVYQTIFEQYLPRSTNDILPSSFEGRILSIAEKTDNLVGYFKAGLAVTGSADPFGLRRQALAIVNLLRKELFNIPFLKLIDKAIELYNVDSEHNKGIIKKDIIEFIRQRISNMMLEEKIRYDIVKACIHKLDDIIFVFIRASALNKLKDGLNFNETIIAFKRVINILPKDMKYKVIPDEIDERLLKEKEEKELYNKYVSAKSGFIDLVNKKQYEDGFKKLAELCPFIDNFFDKVMVMAEDVNIKNNRLSLLKNINELFKQIGDFSQIVQ